jgi:hypothetical protein
MGSLIQGNWNTWAFRADSSDGGNAALLPQN